MTASTPNPREPLEVVIARDLIAFAQVAGMPDSYWHTDRRIARACAVLGITPDEASEMETEDE